MSRRSTRRWRTRLVEAFEYFCLFMIGLMVSSIIGIIVARLLGLYSEVHVHG